MKENNIIRYYESVIEKGEALWILKGKNPRNIEDSHRQRLQKEVYNFLQDAHSLPPTFCLMVAECLHAILEKYKMQVPLYLKFELAAKPLIEMLGEELSEWQKILRQKVLE
ncbi:MAG: hypothetical protein D6805_08860 [Planctomycetota bacterium]|nr:MAG: hypothetical protein D6805_08860 [Planctomycetota bacterium]